MGELEKKARLLKRLKIVEIILWIIFIIIVLYYVMFMIVAAERDGIGCALRTESQQDKDIYNATARKYMGEVVRGIQVKSLIEEIINKNDENVGETGKFIGLEVIGEIPNYTTADNLKKVCEAANVYIKDGENSYENVEEAKKEMRKLYKAISSGKNYSVSYEVDGYPSGMTDGIIHTVYIKELDVSKDAKNNTINNVNNNTSTSSQTTNTTNTINNQY